MKDVDNAYNLRVLKGVQEFSTLLQTLGLCPQEKLSLTKPIRVICHSGHEAFVRYPSLLKRRPVNDVIFGCQICRRENHLKPYLESLEKAGLKLKSSLNLESPLQSLATLECSRGHQFSVKLGDLKNSRSGCPDCLRTPKKTQEEIESLFLNTGYKLLDSYKGINEKHRVVCPNGHEYTVTIHKFRSGKRCSKCVGNYKKSFEEIQTKFVEEGYELLEKNLPINNVTKTPLLFRCPNGHEHRIRWNSFQGGQRCGVCSVGRHQSKPELELLSFLSSNNIKVIHRDESLGVEIDLMIPEKKTGIEYCGLYYHSVEMSKKDKTTRHLKKMEVLNRNGYKLITIFEDEWLNKKEVVLGRLLSILDRPIEKIYARTLMVGMASKEEGSAFFAKNHLQENSPFSFAVKVYNQEKIYGMVSFGKPSRAHIGKNIGENVFELKRLCFLPGATVVGGTSKMFEFAKTKLEQEKVDGLVSFCDLRWGTGQVYKNLGFELASISRPSPHFTDGRGKRWNYLTAYKNKEVKRLLKIYDCGHQKWVLKLAKP